MCVGGGGGGFVRDSLCLCCKIHGGDYVHVYKFEQGGGGGGLFGGYCPTLSHCALKHFNYPHRESMRYLNVFTTHRCVARCVTGLSQA